MTLNQIAYNLLEIYKGGKVNNDFTPSIRQIKFIILYYRALLIRRDIQKNTFRSQTVDQSLGCMELELVDKAECCEIEIGCEILRTKKKIPAPIRLNDRDALWVMKIDGTTALTYIDYSMVNYLKGNKFTGTKLYWFYRDNYIYVVGGSQSTTLKWIKPRGIFEDPSKAAAMVECEGTECLTDDSEFPMPMDMVQNLTQAVLKGELNFMLQAPQDDENNANDNK